LDTHHLKGIPGSQPFVILSETQPFLTMSSPIANFGLKNHYHYHYQYPLSKSEFLYPLVIEFDFSIPKTLDFWIPQAVLQE